MLIDSGSTGNYLSARCQIALDLKVKPEEDFERLTLADGSEVHAQGYGNIFRRIPVRIAKGRTTGKYGS